MRPQETMAAGENCLAPELNEEEVIELLENATLDRNCLSFTKEKVH